MNDLEKNIRFKKKERLAIYFIFLLIIALYIFKFTYKPEIIPFEQSISLEDVLSEKTKLSKIERDTLISKIRKKNNLDRKQKRKKKFKEKTNLELKPFNPNTIDSIGLIKLGLRSYVISNLLNYRKKGGKIKTCQELQKIYGITEDDIQRITPYCNIPKPAKKTYTPIPKEKPKRKTETSIIYLNKATAEELQSINGIGPILSHRIIRYRNSLGGFHSIDQLYKVYKIDTTVIQKNRFRFRIDTSQIKISINGDFKALIRHPLLGKGQVNAILAYKKQHGPFTDLNQLYDLRALSPDLVQRILPSLEL